MWVLLFFFMISYYFSLLLKKEKSLYHWNPADCQPAPNAKPYQDILTDYSLLKGLDAPQQQQQCHIAVVDYIVKEQTSRATHPM